LARDNGQNASTVLNASGDTNAVPLQFRLLLSLHFSHGGLKLRRLR
jgi:hypothetical protein